MHTAPKPGLEKLKDLFSLHAGERRGFLLLALILVLLTAIVVYVRWFRPPDTQDLRALEAEMEAWIAQRKALRAGQDSVLPEPFPFDPNTLERAQWRQLGLSDRQVDGLERYMAKGGRFRTKKDLAKMYSIPPAQYARLEPFILLPDSLSPHRQERDRPTRTYSDRAPSVGWRDAPRTERPARTIVEVNSADTVALTALPGIGPAFARGIVKYRTSLGGFHSLDQLAEIYVLRDKPDAVERLKELLRVDPALVKRIPINTCTVEELAAHPYVRWKIAKPLIAYRAQHGPFTDLAGIKACHAVTDSVFIRLVPYLTLDSP